MKNRNTKVKFTDIAGMLERDEMREIIGGCGQSYSCGQSYGCGALQSVQYSGGNSLAISQASFIANTSGYIPPSIPSAPYTTSSSSSSNTSYSNAWNITSNGATTSNPVSITRLLDLYYTNNMALTTSQINTFITNESTLAGQTANNLQLYGTVLPQVVVWNNYQGPSTIPQGIVINNGVAQIDYSAFGSNGASNGSIGSSSYSNYLQQGVPQTDCFFQCLGWISQMNGDTVHDANYYASIYAFTHPNTAIIPNFNLSSFNKPSTNGMPVDQASAFAGTFFKATDYSGASNQFLSNWINPSTNPSGDNQLIGVYRTETGGLHAIAITSVNGSTISFYDPQKGISDSRDMSKFVSFYGITNKP